MLEQSSDSLTRIMIGKYQRMNLKKLKSDNLQHILEVEEREENEPSLIRTQIKPSLTRI